MLATVHPTLNDHIYDMRPTCVVHVVWRHFILESSTPFSWVPWLVLWLRHQLVTDVTAWLIDPNPSCSKNREIKERKRKRKVKSTIDDLDRKRLIEELYHRRLSLIGVSLLYKTEYWKSLKLIALPLWGHIIENIIFAVIENKLSLEIV